MADLKPALLTLDYKVTRFSLNADSISVRPLKKQKAKKFRLSKLLEDVSACLASRQPEVQINAPKPPVGSLVQEPKHKEPVKGKAPLRIEDLEIPPPAFRRRKIKKQPKPPTF